MECRALHRVGNTAINYCGTAPPKEALRPCSVIAGTVLTVSQDRIQHAAEVHRSRTDKSPGFVVAAIGTIRTRTLDLKTWSNFFNPHVERGDQPLHPFLREPVRRATRFLLA